MFLLNNKPLPLDTTFTVGEGDDAVQYPANWLRYATESEKQAIGITEVADAPSYDDRFYWGVDNPKELEDVEAKDENGNTLLDEKGNPVITKGLKSNFISQVKHTAGLLLAESDWMVIRKIERNIDIPDMTMIKRASIVALANQYEIDINAVTTVDELAKLNLSFSME